MSFENASIITSCSRWPLLIDPQLQGSSWIRGSQGDNLSPININQKHWMRELTKIFLMVELSYCKVFNNRLKQHLDPLLSRAIVKKGGSYTL
jgi:dynein heavy chain